jgi:shikimate dehydrogenase
MASCPDENPYTSGGKDVAMLSGQGRLAGVMGWPVGHSRSPRLHNYWLDRYGIDGAYVPLAVRPDDFEDAVRALPKLGFRGSNVTLPHKEAALRAVDQVDETAQRIGAVNTVVVGEQGELSGSNTDAFGFIEALKSGAPDLDLDDGCVALIGAGGAARAIVVALLDAGVGELRVINRTRARAEALADAFGSRIMVVDWEQRAEALAGSRLLVNSTSQGMSGEAPLDLPLDDLPGQAVVMDAVYIPLETPLLAAARAKGCAAVGGLGMLLHQARPGFEAWFGRVPEVTAELEAFVLQDLSR